MNAKLYRDGSNWCISALALHRFATAREARQWAKANRLKLIRSDKNDR